ncbi:signal recognition particle subunit SRP19/SEC65 family protein [Ignisphaera sp. 4213-co]|uniref:Signal recognition particle 19 kDa protein n=1 Tax=Ignisphaera cupida TaxID=3050454 RepID=A0ABD4Z4J8_9CREN|nr:signal recognition particle subunit SRP19/SEC65 family protein [Ignisphaera sp. 4213-co]MDK6027853.1 signal recognition particle subunit SRP19/SEC65 family protein [Ignisphaera sp. 4213-co]
MPMRRIWLQYFDCSLPRRLGRKLSKQFCIENPKPEELLEACENLGIKCMYVQNKKYPRVWYRPSGLIVVETSFSKYHIIKLLARYIHEKRSARR